MSSFFHNVIKYRHFPENSLAIKYIYSNSILLTGEKVEKKERLTVLIREALSWRTTFKNGDLNSYSSLNKLELTHELGNVDTYNSEIGI